MNKEQEELLDEAYTNYCKYTSSNSSKWNYWMRENGDGSFSMFTQEEFINKCKTDPEFSEKWGLTIEERGLSTDERKSIYEKEYSDGMEVSNNNWLNSKLTTRNVPAKVITTSYNNKTIEIYE